MCLWEKFLERLLIIKLEPVGILSGNIWCHKTCFARSFFYYKINVVVFSECNQLKPLLDVSLFFSGRHSYSYTVCHEHIVPSIGMKWTCSCFRWFLFQVFCSNFTNIFYLIHETSKFITFVGCYIVDKWQMHLRSIFVLIFSPCDKCISHAETLDRH